MFSIATLFEPHIANHCSDLVADLYESEISRKSRLLAGEQWLDY